MFESKYYYMFTHNTSALSATHSVAEGFIRPSASGPNDSSWLPQQTVSKHVDNRLLDHILGKQTLSVCWRLPNIWWSWLISALDNHWQRAQSTQSFPGPSRRSNCGSCYSSILRHRPWIRQTMGFSFSFLHHSVFVTVFVRLFVSIHNPDLVSELTVQIIANSFISISVVHIFSHFSHFSCPGFQFEHSRDCLFNQACLNFISRD
jgi:hypothetical protein